MERKLLNRIKTGHMIRREESRQLPEVYDACCETLPEKHDDHKNLPSQSENTSGSVLRKIQPHVNLKALAGKLKPVRKKLRRGGTAAVLGLSVTLAGLFNSPSDLMQQQVIQNLNQDYAVEYMIDDDVSQDADEKKKAAEGSGSGGIFNRIKEAVRSFILGLPQGVRACVCIPLWAVGYVIIHLITLLFQSVVSPALGHIIGLALFALILLAVYTVTMKCLFPKMPLRKILSRKNIVKVLAGAVVLEILDIFLPMFWQDYIKVRDIVLSVAGIIILGILISGFLRHRRKAKYRQVEGKEYVDCR